jgi:hypothetical protein
MQYLKNLRYVLLISVLILHSMFTIIAIVARKISYAKVLNLYTGLILADTV